MMCSFLMHLMMHPELKQAITIMKFLKYTDEPRYLKHRFITFILAEMKLLSAICCEMVLIRMIAEVDDIRDIIKDFVALGFIVQIDNYFAQNIEGFATSDLIGSYECQLIINQEENYREWMLRKMNELWHIGSGKSNGE